MKVFLGICLGLMLAGTALADSTWTYTGNVINYQGGINFGPGGAPPEDAWDVGPNPCNCALDGTVTLNASGQPVAWSFTVTGLTWNTSNSSFASFYDNLTNIYPPFNNTSPLFTLWNLSLVDTSGDTLTTMFTTFSMSSARDTSSNGLFVLSDPGKWTEVDPVATAEPATGLLVGLGLALAGLMRRGRKKPADCSVWESLG
jgi:hypothetical protein